VTAIEEDEMHPLNSLINTQNREMRHRQHHARAEESAQTNREERPVRAESGVRKRLSLALAALVTRR
jgi:hypothetical protein